MAAENNKFQLQRQQEEPQVLLIKQELERLSQEIIALNKSQSILSNEVKTSKQSLADVTNKIGANSLSLANVQNDIQKLNSQIIAEPEKLKKVSFDPSFRFQQKWKIEQPISCP